MRLSGNSEIMHSWILLKCMPYWVELVTPTIRCLIVGASNSSQLKVWACRQLATLLTYCSMLDNMIYFFQTYNCTQYMSGQLQYVRTKEEDDSSKDKIAKEGQLCLLIALSSHNATIMNKIKQKQSSRLGHSVATNVHVTTIILLQNIAVLQQLT